MTGKIRLKRTGAGIAALGAVLAVGLTSANADAPAPSAAATVPETGALFNDPNGTAEEQYAIRDYLHELVDEAQTGSTISMSIYNITDFDADFADAVVAAADRGVNTRVVLESTASAQTGSGQAIIDALGTDTNAESWVSVCTVGCHGTRHNHNKFYLFSDVSDVSDVVVQSSANFTVSNGSRFWNNAVTFVENPGLYQSYLDYFYDLARDTEDADYYHTDSLGGVKTYFFPRAGSTSATDTVYNTLENVSCTGNSNVGTSDGRTIIRVAMWYFGRVAIAERLADLGVQGCEVQIAYTDMLAEPKSALDSAPNVTLVSLEDDDARDIIHSKYMLIEGSYAGVADRSVVFTGSPNYSDAALRLNDEAMLRIYNDTIHDQYVDNFEDIWASGVAG